MNNIKKKSIKEYLLLHFLYKYIYIKKRGAMTKSVKIWLVQKDYAGIAEIFLKVMKVDERDFNYVASYEYEITEENDDKTILNKSFSLFNEWINVHSLLGFKVLDEKRKHNLSVNDVISIDSRFYRCERNGWKLLDNIKIF